MKMNVIVKISMAMLTAGLLFALAGCNGDTTINQQEMEDEAVVQDAVANQIHCPVMEGMEINRDIYVDHDGQRVYFCCAGCVEAFNAEPEKYMDRLH